MTGWKIWVVAVSLGCLCLGIMQSADGVEEKFRELDKQIAGLGDRPDNNLGMGSLYDRSYQTGNLDVEIERNRKEMDTNFPKDREYRRYYRYQK